MTFRNRDEVLIASAEGRGVVCDWKWTSDLNLARVFPSFGLRLFHAAFDEWPVRADSEPPARTDPPEISFIIGHRGPSRIGHLKSTLESLFAQEEIRAEYIVVEQDSRSRLEGTLPTGVRHVLLRPPAEFPYSRSWAFNAGARAAEGRVLVFHDNDILAPSSYGREILRLHGLGYRAMRLQRFLFYLTARSTESFVRKDQEPGRVEVECVRQNTEGGTIAIDRDAFFEIGGFDEGFLGWGGEDNEFFDRLRTLRGYQFGYLPFVHLWHEAQTEKADASVKNQYFDVRMRIPVKERIAELRSRDFGSTGGPVGVGVIPAKAGIAQRSSLQADERDSRMRGNDKTGMP